MKIRRKSFAAGLCLVAAIAAALAATPDAALHASSPAKAAPPGWNYDQGAAAKAAPVSARVTFGAPAVVQTSGSRRIVWPAPGRAFAEGAAMIDIVQPTASGRPVSGLFGCVRNDGRRFHEGIDVAPIARDRRGHALDQIYAVLPGVVRYIGSAPGNSGYGRYLVIEHTQEDVAVYTLYAHLASIASGLGVGQQVQAGTVLGIMGHSAGGYSIPASQAHLHFEVGLRMTDNFQPWYDAQKFGSPNRQGLYNGMNLSGIDPTHFWETVRAGEFRGFADYITALPTAFTLRIKAAQVPDFARRYPALVKGGYPAAGVAGWQIDFTWYGVPKTLIPLGTESFAPQTKEGDIALISFNPAVFEGTCRDTLVFNPENPSSVRLGRGIIQELKKIFDF